MNKQVKGEDIATVILPLGETKDSTSEIKTNVNLSELPYSKDGTIIHEAGSDCIYDEEAVREYGRITKVIEWGDVTEPSNLLAKAKEQLKFYMLSSLSLELTVFDLHLLNVNTQSIRVGQKLRVVSAPHGLDIYMIVQKITLDIDEPDKSVIRLVTEERSAIKVNKGSITNKTNTNDKNIVSTQNSQQVLNNQMNDYIVDLSGYATVSEVNAAFNELGMLIGGM